MLRLYQLLHLIIIQCFSIQRIFKDDLQKVMQNEEYSSVIEFVSAMPHIVRVDRPYPKGDWMLFDATTSAIDDEKGL